MGSPIDSAIDKAAVLAAVRERVASDLAAVEGSQRATQQGATHEESRPENDKDTRALEATYLARGLAERVAALRAAVSELAAVGLRSYDEDAPIAMTALVLARDDDGGQWRYFVLPAGGGIKVEVGGETVRVVTPASPVGRRLLGRREGDEIELPVGGGSRSVDVAEVR